MSSTPTPMSWNKANCTFPHSVHSLWEYKNKVQNWSFCWLCLALSYLVVTKTKNKNLFFCFFNFVRSFRDKKDAKICLANRRDKVAPNITKKKKTQILYFVLCLPQGMAWEHEKKIGTLSPKFAYHELGTTLLEFPKKITHCIVPLCYDLLSSFKHSSLLKLLSSVVSQRA